MPPRVSVMELMLGSGPRFARDAFGPVLAFYLCWKLFGLGAGVAAATCVSIAAYAWERRQARSGLAAGIGLGIALVQAAAGLAAGSARAFLAPPVIVSGAYGLAFLGSVIVGRPLAGIFAQETYPFPPEVRVSATYRRTFSRISLAWAAYLLSRSALRLAILVGASVDVFVLVNVVTGAPITLALMAWSIWYGVRSFRRSEEWGRYLET